MQKNKYSLGGEQSGHIILGQYLSTGDGILAALKVVELLSNNNKLNNNTLLINSDKIHYGGMYLPNHQNLNKKDIGYITDHLISFFND